MLSTVVDICFICSHGSPDVASSDGGAADNCDTVGAVALDACGNFAYATSTGGIPAKCTGRVGDCPLLGEYHILCCLSHQQSVGTL